MNSIHTQKQKEMFIYNFSRLQPSTKCFGEGFLSVFEMLGNGKPSIQEPKNILQKKC